MKVNDFAILGDEFWETEYLKNRQEIKALTNDEQLSLKQMLDPNSQLCDLFTDYFKFENRAPEKVCRGCPGHDDARLFATGSFVISSVLETDLLALSASEPIGIEVDERSFYDDLDSCGRLVRDLCRQGKLRFIRCSKAVRSYLIDYLTSRNEFYYVGFKEFNCPSASSREISILFQSDVDSVGLDINDILDRSTYILTDRSLKYEDTEVSVLERLRSVKHLST